MTVSASDGGFRSDEAIAVSGEVVRVTVTGIDVRGRMFRESATVLMLDRCNCAVRSKSQPLLDRCVLVEFDYPHADPKRRISQGRVLLNQAEMHSGYYQVVIELKFAQLVKVAPNWGEAPIAIAKPEPPPIANAVERPLHLSNRRRSERVVIGIPVTVFAHNLDGNIFEERTNTVTVNAHGALVTLKTEIDSQKPVLLVNTKTGIQVHCRIARRNEIQRGELGIGLEFASPFPKFWGINFPPEDWNPTNR